MKQARSRSIGIVLVLILAGIFFFLQPGEEIDDSSSLFSGDILTGEEENNDEMPSSGTVDNTFNTGTITYTNTEYGFEVDLPASWEEYRIFYRQREETPNGLVDDIAIALPTIYQRPGGYTGINMSGESTHYADIAIVLIRTPEGYERLACQEVREMGCLRDEDTLGHNTEFYFTIIGPNAWPEDRLTSYRNPNNYPYQNIDYFSPIIKSFKFLQKTPQ